jgi:hypothetical protein
MRSPPESLSDPAHPPGILPFHVRQDTVFLDQAGKYNASCVVRRSHRDCAFLSKFS